MAARQSQRVSRACRQCAARKTKCDKQLPCETCRMRGLALECEVEPVVVKGTLRGREDRTQPSYADLVRENARLRTRLSLDNDYGRAAFDLSSREGRDRHRMGWMTMHDEFEQQLYTRIRQHYRRSTVCDASAILFPPADCAIRLLDLGGEWRWLHMAVDHAQFDAEVRVFVSKCQQVPSGQAAEHAWLGLYFAWLTTTMMMLNEDEKQGLGITYGIDATLRNWFDSAVYYLHLADFLKIPDIRNVQTISLLCECCAYYSEFNLYYNILANGVRISQSLGLTSDASNYAMDARQAEIRRRLWWSLVIKDWMTFQIGMPVIRAEDFDVRPPSVLIGLDEPETHHAAQVYAIQWQVVLINVCQALHSFRSALPQADDIERLVEVVVAADNLLAETISQMPTFLSTDDLESRSDATRTQSRPWLAWQNASLKIILLYYRIVVNRVVIKYASLDSAGGRRAVLVCTDAAHGVLSALQQEPELQQRQRMWFILFPVFSAATILAKHGERCRCSVGDQQHQTEVQACQQFFEAMTPACLYAHYAALVLYDVAAI